MSPLDARGAPRSPLHHLKVPTPPGRERHHNATDAQSQRFTDFTQEGEAWSGFGPCSRLQGGASACNALKAVCGTADQRVPLAQSPSPSQLNCSLDPTKLDTKAAELEPPFARSTVFRYGRGDPTHPRCDPNYHLSQHQRPRKMPSPCEAATPDA
jgi:hypothetical protein